MITTITTTTTTTTIRNRTVRNQSNKEKKPVDKIYRKKIDKNNQNHNQSMDTNHVYHEQRKSNVSIDDVFSCGSFTLHIYIYSEYWRRKQQQTKTK